MKKKTVLELHRDSIEQFSLRKKLPLDIIVDDVRSLNNIGSVFRTADAFAVNHIYLCGISATPPHPDIHKTALGAEDSVAWSYHKDVVDLVNSLKIKGVTVCALEQVHGSISLDSFHINPNQHYALIIGNEVMGVNQHAVDAADFAIEIPQFGTKHSLNVSISAGIAIWEFFRQFHL